MTHLDTFSPRSYAEDFGGFIKESPTSYHAARRVAATLVNAGFTEVDEHGVWSNLSRGVLVRGGAVIAWMMPDEVTEETGFRVVGSHTDSPAFKVKPVADSPMLGYSQVNVEVYGGPLLNSWLNRDLGIAGQITTIDGETHLVRTGPLMTIPQLAPHLDRTQNAKLEMSPQRDYHPVWACGVESVMEEICKSAGVDSTRVAGTDLYSYDVADFQIYGGPAGEDFFVAGRQDNLTSVHASLQAFLSIASSADESGSFESNDIIILAAFDHEEVGSSSPTGANGPILETVMRRIVGASEFAGDEGYWRMLANSSCISSDAGHAVNPNKPDKHDPAHYPVLGNGPLLKLNANQRYATDAVGSALWLRAAAQAGESTQEFVGNNDVPCGSTIGPFTASRLGITTVDVGVPMLSMHSVREITSPRDLLGMAKILEGYYLGF